MDSMHDLGGKQGFGPVPVKSGDAAFHHDWERRMWAMARGGALPPSVTIDWFRHGLENMVPADYLTISYFNKWCANYLMLLVDAGHVTLEEIANGHLDQPSNPAPAMSLQQALAKNQSSNINFSREIDAAPGFSVGDTVTTKRVVTADHTRLPAYARGATGRIITHHGAHHLADKSAQGIDQAEHLYTVAFSAPELWGVDANPNDSITLELWESYFV